VVVSAGSDTPVAHATPNLTKSLCVLGGSSAGTPILIEALGNARAAGALPSLQVRLYGRAAERLAAIEAHSNYRLTQLAGDTDAARSGILLSTHTRMADAVTGADLILCQVRIGGMRERACDETLPLEFGIPGDEGLGPSGLASFLRARPSIRHLARECHEFAPSARFLMMSSPLGLLTAVAAEAFGAQCCGVCELPLVTAARVVDAVRQSAGLAIEEVLYYGLNHQSWLHAFRDANGADRTAEVLTALDAERLLGIDSEIVRREGAVPLPYLRYYYHTEREVRRQRARSETRGAELARWAEAVHHALAREEGPDHQRAAQLLSRRDMRWYAEGVVPVIGAMLGGGACTLPLNEPDAAQGLFPGHIVERPYRIAGWAPGELSVPPLPPSPHRLMHALVNFEAAALALPDDPAPQAIAAVLREHPLVTDAAVADRLGIKLWKQVVGGFGRPGNTVAT